MDGTRSTPPVRKMVPPTARYFAIPAQKTTTTATSEWPKSPYWCKAACNRAPYDRPDKRAVCSNTLQNRLRNTPSDSCCARSFLGVQESPPVHPRIARQITAALWKQPPLRGDWNILLFSCSSRGCRCDCLLRGARNHPANDRFAGWNSCRRGTSALSTEIDPLGRDHKSHLLPSAQREPHSQPLV